MKHDSKPLERGKSRGNGGVKAQFTTKLHFFALYQQNQTPQTGLQQIFTMKSKT
ncbi:hypothetical protein [Rhodoferax sp.]|uniref:hypothetical protein n=1 Tax=Rhodoferax sp. TaxID=50421 RepID=UPI0026204665|nr:hypothetical protein [Rhodoferax sp.]MDD4942063.1 hypothetical protein [Rhodoferax sp.]MDD5480887.1 hypothetical protein [Rhodoferax sp.]